MLDFNLTDRTAKTETFLDLLEHKLSCDECGHTPYIVEIGPELAQKLLTLNFAHNRKLSKSYVDRLSTDMKNGEWEVSNDAIVLNHDMELGNGQHRLNAIIQSQTSQKFLILYGSPKKAFQKFDTGKKRTMENRITIAGTEISLKECCIIRHAMNDYANPSVGTQQYGYSRHDGLVADTYRKHKEFLLLVNASNPQGSSFVYAAALKMYAEMIHHPKSHANAIHNHDPLTRAQLFIDLCLRGYSTTDISSGPTEIAAVKLRNAMSRKKAERKGQYWNEKPDLRVTITAAFKFMLGERVQALQSYKTDPFKPFLTLPTTNPQDYQLF